MCFETNGRSSHAAHCVKSRIINKAVEYIHSVDTDEQQWVVIQGMLQSSPLEYHMNTISIDQS